MENRTLHPALKVKRAIKRTSCASVAKYVLNSAQQNVISLLEHNIIFSGGVGALIDHSKGTGYDYPNLLPVQMGGAVVVDKKAESEQKTVKAGN